MNMDFPPHNMTYICLSDFPLQVAENSDTIYHTSHVLHIFNDRIFLWEWEAGADSADNKR